MPRENAQDTPMTRQSPAPASRGESEHRQPRRRIISIVASVLLLIGASGFLLGFAASAIEHRFISDSIELPLSHVRSMTVDRQGNVYLGLEFYSRIQMYDDRGKFLRGWFLPAGSGSLDLRMNDDQQLQVHAARGSRIVVYDARGTLVKEYNVSPTFHLKPPRAGHDGRIDLQGNSYALRGGWWYPRIIKTTPAGDSSTIINTPWYLLPWMGPLPTWLFVMAGILLLILFAKPRAAHSAQVQVPGSDDSG